MFQMSKENTCELYGEMNRLLKMYAGNLLKKEVVFSC